MKSSLRVVKQMDEPQRLRDVPDPPAQMANAFAIEEWLLQSRDMIAEGVTDFSQVMLGVLEMYCDQMAIARECRLFIEQEGIIIGGKPNEKIAVKNQAQKLALLHLEKLEALVKKSKSKIENQGTSNGWNTKLLA